MSLYKIAASSLAALSITSAAYAEPQILTLDASPSTQTVKAGDGAMVTLTQTNMTGVDIMELVKYPNSNQADYNYIIRIHDETGLSPRMTNRGKESQQGIYDTSADHHSIHTGVVRGIMISKGKTAQDSMDLTKVFDLKPKHTYEVYFVMKQKFLEFDKDEGKIAQHYQLRTPLKSNPIKIIMQ